MKIYKSIIILIGTLLTLFIGNCYLPNYNAAVFSDGDDNRVELLTLSKQSGSLISAQSDTNSLFRESTNTINFGSRLPLQLNNFNIKNVSIIDFRYRITNSFIHEVKIECFDTQRKSSSFCNEMYCCLII